MAEVTSRTLKRGSVAGGDNASSGRVDVHSWQGLTRLLKLAKESGMEPDDYAEFRDDILRYAQSGGTDKTLRDSINAAAKRLGGGAALIVEAVGETDNVQASKAEPVTSNGFGGARPVPQFTAPSSVPSPVSESPMPSKPAPPVQTQPPVEQFPAPPSPPTPPSSPIPPPKPPPEPAPPPPLKPTPPAPAEKPAPPPTPPSYSPGVDEPVKTLDEYKMRIAEIKRTVNAHVGNPVTLLDSANALGRDYMRALVNAMKAVSGGAPGTLTLSMSKLEEVFKEVMALPPRNGAAVMETPEAPPPKTEPVPPPPPPKPFPKPAPVSPPVSEPPPKPVPPSPALDPVPTAPPLKPTPPASEPEPLAPSPRQEDKVTRIPIRPTPVPASKAPAPQNIPVASEPPPAPPARRPGPPPQPRPVLRPTPVLKPTPLPVEDKAPVPPPPPPSPVPPPKPPPVPEPAPPPLKPAPQSEPPPASPVQKTPAQTVERKQVEVPSNGLSVPIAKPGPTPAAPAGKASVVPPSVTEDLNSPQITAGLDQLLSEWQIFRSGGLFGTHKAGREHPLFQKLSPLPMSIVAIGSWENAKKDDILSMRDYINGWLHEQGIAYLPTESFEHYLRRVVKKVLQRQKESKK